MPLTKLPALLAVALALISAARLHAQSIAAPVPVSMCDLLRNPSKYDGREIRVRGEVHLAFEDFTLHDSPCGDELPWVWLQYADGTEATPFAPFNRARVVKSQVLNDAEMKKFRDFLAQKRQLRPDGSTCWDRECDFYHVTATIDGVFHAVRSYFRGRGGEVPNGYGHLGCCHLLTIRQVSHVEARETPVPRSGTFSCRTQRWALQPGIQMQIEKKIRQICSPLADCDQGEKGRYSNFSSHWGDHADIESGWFVLGRPGQPSRWYSKDLLLSYWLLEKRNAQPIAFRESCTAVPSNAQ